MTCSARCWPRYRSREGAEMPGRRGFLTLLGSAMLIVAGRVLGVQELFVVGTALAVLPLAAGVWLVAQRRPRPSVARRCEPAIARPGDEISVILTVTNDSARRCPTLVMNEHQPGRRRRRIWLAPLAPGAQESGSYRLAARGRGVFAVGPTDVYSVDPFGLWRRRVLTGPVGEVVVAPATVVVSAFADSTRSGRTISRAKSGDGEFLGLRPFREGDETRDVHWRSSARKGSLLVLERDSSVADTLDIHVDMRADNHSGNSFELALEIAGSLVEGALSNRQPVTLTLGSQRLTGAGPWHAPHILTALAKAQPVGERRARDERSNPSRPLSDGSCGVWVVGPRHPPLAPTRRSWVVVCSPAGLTPPRPPESSSRSVTISVLAELPDLWANWQTLHAGIGGVQ